MSQHWTNALVALDACDDAVAWARTQPDYATAWATCERGDWMLWVAGRLAAKPGTKSRKRLVAAALDCAKLAWPYVREHDRRVVRRCYRITARYLRGEATLAEVQDAADDAVSYAVSYAAYAASAAVSYASAAVSYAAADVSYAAADADANKGELARTLRRAANIVRRHYPTPPRLPKGGTR